MNDPQLVADDTSDEPAALRDTLTLALMQEHRCSARSLYLSAGMKEHHRRLKKWGALRKLSIVQSAADVISRLLPSDTHRTDIVGISVAGLLIDPVKATSWVNHQILINETNIVTQRIKANLVLREQNLLVHRIAVQKGLRPYQKAMGIRPPQGPPTPLVKQQIDYRRVHRLVALIAVKWRCITLRSRRGFVGAGEFTSCIPTRASQGVITSASLANLTAASAAKGGLGASPSPMRGAPSVGRGRSPGFLLPGGAGGATTTGSSLGSREVSPGGSMLYYPPVGVPASTSSITGSGSQLSTPQVVSVTSPNAKPPPKPSSTTAFPSLDQ